MTVQKHCADFLRTEYRALTGDKLRSGHAHEIVAAFFGYSSGAALRAETRYPLSHLGKAAIFIPDLELVEKRFGQLDGLPDNKQPLANAVLQIIDHLTAAGHMHAEIWQGPRLKEVVFRDLLEANHSTVLDALSSEIATTNAFFDGPDWEEFDIEQLSDAMVVNASAALEGDQDPERPFSGDRIASTSIITLKRIAGRNGFAEPKWDISGELDDSRYFD